MTAHGRLVKLTWYTVSALYALLRVALAARFAGPYGLSVPWFAVVELTSTVPYAVGVARTVAALADRRLDRALRWGPIAFAGWIAPDLFVLATTHRPPVWLVVVVLVWLSISGVLGVRSLTTQIRTRRLSNLTAATSPAA
jgi:hypothetical protein